MAPDPLDPRLTPGRFLEDASARHGDRTALVFEGRTWSYAGLRDEARALARGLAGAGVVKGARVGVWMANRPEWIASAFAVGMLGGVLVPVNTFARPEELAFILRHSDTSLLLMQASLGERDLVGELLGFHPEIAGGEPGRLRLPALPQLRRVVVFGGAAAGGVEGREALQALGADFPEELVDATSAEVEPADDGILVYTSGTSARPKGVLHAQRSAILQSWRFAELLRLEPSDRVFTTYPFFWTAGIAMSIGPTLAAGARLLLLETFEPGAALDLIESGRATAVHAWPHQHKAMAEHPSAPARDLRALRKLDAESPLAKLAGIEKDEYGSGGSYGLSETFTIASMLPCDAPAELRRQSHGRPLPGVSLRIVDPETGAPLPPGAEGEIAVKGVTFMRGYYKVPPELYLDAHGYFRTQDAGHLDAQGLLHWSGRLDRLIKTGGANVSPLEVEEALAAHPDLKLAVAVGVRHPTLGQALVLCAVPVEGARVDEAEIRRYLRERMAAYKVPRRVLAFRPEELSYTGSQKVQVAPLVEAATRRLEAEGAVIDGHRYGG